MSWARTPAQWTTATCGLVTVLLTLAFCAWRIWSMDSTLADYRDNQARMLANQIKLLEAIEAKK
jgi:hypothetical protein